MQNGSVLKHGGGKWRGYWREGVSPETGKPMRRSTATWPTKGEARAALNLELDRIDRIAKGDDYRPPITLKELADRFLDQYDKAPKTVKCARGRLVRPLEAFGGREAGGVTAEQLRRFLKALPAEKVGKAYRRDIVRALRQVYAFGVDEGLVDANPAKKVEAPKPVKSDKILPFESWAEVELVATECGAPWGDLVRFMADSGARPLEALDLEWRHVDLDAGTVELPGRKTELAWRTVHLTTRGVAAIRAMPRSISTRQVFHRHGTPISWTYFRREVWRPALDAAGLADRVPYNLRHTYAKHSLDAGVPMAVVAHQLGHTSLDMCYRVYGGWDKSRGVAAAALRENLASGTQMAQRESDLSPTAE